MPSTRPRRLTWVTAPKGAMCHMNKCQNSAIEDRLCAKCAAEWRTNGCQPPMPNYGQRAPHGYRQDMELLDRDVRESLRAVSDQPLRAMSDVTELKIKARYAESMVEELRAKKRAEMRPFLEAARKQKRAWDERIRRYSEVVRLAQTRASVGEERLSVPPPPRLPAGVRRREVIPRRVGRQSP